MSKTVSREDLAAQQENERASQWEEAGLSFAARAARAHIPLGATFELTPFCNLRCKMCYVRLDRAQAAAIGQELSAKDWIRIAEEAVRAGMLNLQLTGGEPLLRPDFPEIYRALCHMGLILSINTNAALMTEALRDLFCALPPTAFNITLYGASYDTYENLCGDGGAFEKTLRGLTLLSQVPTHLEIRTTFTRHNAHELEAIRSIALRYTNSFAINTQVFKPIRGAVSDVEGCRLTPEQALDVENQNRAYYEQKNKGLPKKGPASVKPDSFYGFDMPPEILSCSAAKSLFAITWDGKMLPCCAFTGPDTQPLTEGFDAAWNRLPKLYESIRLPADCVGCSIAKISGCPNCPANLQAETGDLETRAPYLCTYAKARAKEYFDRRNY